MPIQHAVLALLADGPAHGYAIKAAFEAAVGPQWNPLNIGHLYQVLERLQRDQMVNSTRVAQDQRPDRIVYELTDTGREELARWLNEPSPRVAGFRDDFFLKVMAGARSRDPEVVAAVLGTQRRYLLGELRNLNSLAAEHANDPVVGLLLAAAVRHTNADLEFLDDAEDRLLRDGGASLRSLAPAAEAAPEQPTSQRPRRAG